MRLKPKPKLQRQTKPAGTKVVMVFGTFDLLHPGHSHFFSQAKRHGEVLVVSLARDINVKKIKGLKPWNSERKRLAAIRRLAVVDRAVLGDKRGYIGHIKKVRPAVIALGYDQRAYTKTLRADLKRAGLQTEVVRLRAHQPQRFKTSKLKRKMLKSR